MSAYCIIRPQWIKKSFRGFYVQHLVRYMDAMGIQVTKTTILITFSSKLESLTTYIGVKPYLVYNYS